MTKTLHHVLRPLRELLLQGTSPSQLALCLASGVTLSLFPVIGATTLLCTLAAVVLRVNLPAIQAVNYLASPLQIAMLLPLIRFGEFLFGAPALPFSFEKIMGLIRSDAGLAIATLWRSGLHAMTAWGLLAPPVFAGLYFCSRPVFERIAARRARSGSPSIQGDVAC